MAKQHRSFCIRIILFVYRLMLTVGIRLRTTRHFNIHSPNLCGIITLLPMISSVPLNFLSSVALLASRNNLSINFALCIRYLEYLEAVVKLILLTNEIVLKTIQHEPTVAIGGTNLYEVSRGIIKCQFILRSGIRIGHQ